METSRTPTMGSRSASLSGYVNPGNAKSEKQNRSGSSARAHFYALHCPTFGFYIAYRSEELIHA